MNNIKSPIIITGMHRSGTTLLSKVLENQNIFMGSKKEINNESIFFLKINTWLLSVINSSWDSPLTFNNLDEDQKKIILNKMKELMLSRFNFLYNGYLNLFIKKSLFNMKNSWGWKDPRNTFTLDLWIELFPDAKIINIIRHPLAVSNSLLIRQKKLIELDKINSYKIKNKISILLAMNSFSMLSSNILKNIDDCLLLYKKYQDKSIENSNRYKNKILEIKYEDLLLNSQENIDKIFDFLNIGINKNKMKDLVRKFDSNRIDLYKEENLKYNKDNLDCINY